MADDSLIATLGLKTGEFREELAGSIGLAQTEVQKLETNLEAAGVRMGEEPAKYAAASAKAFQEVMTSEEALNAFREKTAFARMTDEEKLAVLRQQAAGMLDRINGLEGQSAEKNGLLLEYEKKKSEIFDLNAKIKADTLAETKDETAEVSKHPGLLGMVGDAAKGIKQQFGEIGIAIKGAGIGILVAEVISLGKEAISNAQKTRDEYEAAGKTVDGATRSMAAFGDGIKGVKELAVNSVGFLISGWTQLGDLFGSAINRLRGIDEAQEAIAASAAKGAEIQEARLKKLQEEQHNVDSIAAARKAYLEAERSAAAAGQSEQQKMNTLLDQHARILDQIQNTEAGTLAYWERKKALVENEKAIAEQRQKISEQDKQTAEKISQIEESIAQSRRDVLPYAEKLAALEAEIARLVEVAARAGSDRVKYAETEAEVEKLIAERKALVIEHENTLAELKKKAALSLQEELELFVLLSKNQAALTESESARLEVLKLQKQEKQAALEIEQLAAKLIAESLTPAEEARLAELIKQDDKLKEQIENKQKLVTAAGSQASAEASVTSQYEKQLSVVKALASSQSSGGGASGGSSGGWASGGSGDAGTVTVGELEAAVKAAQAKFDVAKTSVFDSHYEDNYNEAYYRLQTLTNALDKAKFLGQSIGSGYGAVKISDLDLSGLTTSYKSNYAIPGAFDYNPPPDVLNQRIEGALNNFFGDLDKQSEQSTSLKEISSATKATTDVITEIKGQLHIILNG